jgi:hypothetical protein
VAEEVGCVGGNGRFKGQVLDRVKENAQAARELAELRGLRAIDSTHGAGCSCLACKRFRQLLDQPAAEPGDEKGGK